MKTKIIILSSFIAVIFLLVFSCIKANNDNLKGYLPVNQKPVYIWSETSLGYYDFQPLVMAVKNNGDTIAVTFDAKDFDGLKEIIYRDSYPPAIGKRVYLEIHNDNGYYYITKASLDSLKIF